MLSFWNKLAAWGSVASLIALAFSLSPAMTSRDVQIEPANLAGLERATDKLNKALAKAEELGNQRAAENEALAASLASALAEVRHELKMKQQVVLVQKDPIARLTRALDDTDAALKASSGLVITNELRATWLESETLRRYTDLAADYLRTGSPDDGLKLVDAVQGPDITAGVVASNENATVFEADSRGEFREKITETLKSGKVRKILRGRYTVRGDCVASLVPDCGEVVIEATSPSSNTRIEWFSGPRDQLAEFRLRRLPGSILAMALKSEAICKIYNRLASQARQESDASS